MLFKEKKIVKKGTYKVFGLKVKGYEIHNGVAKKLSQRKKSFYGTFAHGVFDDDAIRYKIFKKINKDYKGYNFKKYKKKSIQEFAEHVDKHIDMKRIVRELND